MADALVLDGKTTALVLIDLQQGILARELAPYSGMQVAERAAGLAKAAREAGAMVVYVHVDLNAVLALPADKSRRDPHAAAAPASAMELVKEAGYQPETDLLVLKRQPGAFYGTALDQMLRRRGVTTIVLGGVATNIGVESTARAAMDMGYALVFASDAMTSVTEQMHAFSVGTMFPLMGLVRSSAEIEAAFRG